jgi:hypothetical protein
MLILMLVLMLTSLNPPHRILYTIFSFHSTLLLIDLCLLFNSSPVPFQTAISFRLLPLYISHSLYLSISLYLLLSFYPPLPPGPFNTAYKHLPLHLRLAGLSALCDEGSKTDSSSHSGLKTNFWSSLCDVNTCLEAVPSSNSPSG